MKISSIWRRNLKHSLTREFHYNDNAAFDQIHQDYLIIRLKFVSFMLIISYPGLFLVDFFLLKSVENLHFRWGLSSVHFTGFLISIVFFILYDRFHQFLRKSKRVINSYIILYLLLGAAASINSQLLTGNIVAYLVILLAVVTIFPIKPKLLFPILSCIQLIFLAGLSLFRDHTDAMLMKESNSTGTVVIAFIIGYTLYSYQKRDYLNQLKIQRSEESFRGLFDLNPHPLILTRLYDNSILLINKQAIDFYNLPMQEGKPLFADFIFNDDKLRQSIFARLKMQKSIRNLLLEQSDSALHPKWVALNFEWVDYLNEPCCLIDVNDVTHFKQKEKELFEHASTDALTGIMNRRIGLDVLQTHLNSFPVQEFALCYVDINGLKKVNDALGHKAGDELIKVVCRIIQSQLGSEDVFFRQGGDEFIISFFHKTVAEAEQIWDLIEKEFDYLNENNQYPFVISVSHGYYLHRPNASLSLEEMLEKADKEMYKVKRSYQKSI